jgi:hypothetical protein
VKTASTPGAGACAKRADPVSWKTGATGNHEAQTMTVNTLTRPSADFLADWRSDHHELPDAHRTAAGAYIGAIVAHETNIGKLPAEAADTRRLALWQAFRCDYDALLTPPLAVGPNDAFARAMSRL